MVLTVPSVKALWADNIADDAGDGSMAFMTENWRQLVRLAH
jgi:hypothetical protein